MCTINDFSAYEMVSGWNTYGKLACPHCMENNKEFTLTSRSKASFFYCHRCFLPTDHKYRKNKKDFFIGSVENDVAPSRLSVKNCMTWCLSTVTLCLVSNSVSRCFLVSV